MYYARETFRVFVVTTIAYMVMSCGKTQVLKQHDRDPDPKTSLNSTGQKTGAAGSDSGRKASQSDFDKANAVSLADAKHPWDGRPRPVAKETVFNGDSKPPEMNLNSIVSCTEMQARRCVSCCEDSFKFGSDSWDRCINACPQVGVETLSNEY